MESKNNWFYLALFWLINFCLGSFYAWSVYSSWLAEHYSAMSNTVVTVSSLTFVFSVGAACNPISMVIAGFLTDRFGPRLVLFIGGGVTALGQHGFHLAAIGLRHLSWNGVRRHGHRHCYLRCQTLPKDERLGGWLGGRLLRHGIGLLAAFG